jgi:hypothetical protein
MMLPDRGPYWRMDGSGLRDGYRRRRFRPRRLFFFRRRFRHGNRGFRHLFLGPSGIHFGVGVRLRVLATVSAHNFPNEPMPHFKSDILVDRAGMRLLLVYSKFRE